MGQRAFFLRAVLLLMFAAAFIAADSADGAEPPTDRKAPPRLAVRPSTPGNLTPLAELIAGINNSIESTAAENGVAPAPICDDFTFLRRVMLDLTGEIPTTEEAAAFANANIPQKRAKKVQQLLATPAYADRWATFWTAHLVGPRGNENVENYSERLHEWFFNELRSERGLDDMLRATLTAKDTPPAAYLGYRLYRTTLPKTVDHVGRAFLGVRIGCAQCHDHPFDKFTQEDFWGFATFLSYTQSSYSSVSDYDSRATDGENAPPSSDYVLTARYLDGTLVDPTQPLPPVPQGDVSGPAMKNAGGNSRGRGLEGGTTGEKLRNALADLMFTREDLRFDRAITNRVWATLLGRGLIHPVDDIRSNSYGPHDDILDLLAADFRASGRDLRRLLTLIVETQAYQRASTGTARKIERENAVRYFVRADVKPMTPEMFHLAVTRVASSEERYASMQRLRYEDLLLSLRRPDQPNRRATTEYEQQLNRFYASLGAPNDDAPVYVEPSFARALANMNGDYIQRAAQDGANRLKQRQKNSIEYLFGTTLSRPPTYEESSRFFPFREKTETSLWILFNSVEFSSIR